MKLILQKTLLTLICVFSAPALATTSYFTQQDADRKLVYIPHIEDGIWMLDIVEERNDQLPTPISHLSFENYEKLQTLIPPTAMSAETVLEPHFRTEVDSEVVWKAENAWSWEWEKKYAQWVDENLNDDFFFKHGVATDCADAAYAARWIFARIHKLPVANRISGGNVLLTNESMKREWVRLPTADDWFKDKRFLAALRYLLRLSYTHTLFADSYPIAIRPESFLPGVFHVGLSQDSGHTQIINHVNTENSLQVPIMAIASTIPQEVRKLSSYPLVWVSIEKGNAAFLRFRWPMKNAVQGWYLESASKMPYYSLEQFEIQQDETTPSVIFAIIKKLNPQFDPALQINEGVQHLFDLFQERIPVVQAGYSYCRSHNCDPGTPAYEEYSTPSRDKRILSIATEIETFVYWLANNGLYSLETYTNLVATYKLQLESYEVPMLALLAFWRQSLFNSDPRQSVKARWGIFPKEFIEKAKTEISGLAEKRDFLALKKEDSTTLDASIQRKIIGLQNYCEVLKDTPLCEEFKNHLGLAEFKVAEQRKLNFDDLVKWAFWINSDAQWEVDVRRGALSQQYSSTLIKDNIVDAYEGPRDEVILIGEKDVYLLNKTSRAVQALNVAAPRKASVFVDDTTLNLASVEDDIVSLYSITGPERLRHFRIRVLDKVSLSPERLFWMDADHLAVQSVHESRPFIEVFELRFAEGLGARVSVFPSTQPPTHSDYVTYKERDHGILTQIYTGETLSFSLPQFCKDETVFIQTFYSLGKYVAYSCETGGETPEVQNYKLSLRDLTSTRLATKRLPLYKNYYFDLIPGPVGSDITVQYQLVQLNEDLGIKKAYFIPFSSEQLGYINLSNRPSILVGNGDDQFHLDLADPAAPTLTPIHDGGFILDMLWTHYISVSNEDAIHYKAVDFSGNTVLERNYLSEFTSAGQVHQDPIYFGLNETIESAHLLIPSKLGDRPLLTGPFLAQAALARRFGRVPASFFGAQESDYSNFMGMFPFFESRFKDLPEQRVRSLNVATDLSMVIWGL